MLKVNSIDVFYGKVQALKDVSLCLNEWQEIVSVIGANGAGKSTLLQAISGLLKCTRGTIEFEGVRLENLSPERIVKLGISHVPERRELFAEMTVKENLEMGAFLRKGREGVSNDLMEVFVYFPVLKNRANQIAGTLSGGEQQMLALGRGVMAKPKLLLMDEPSLGLAPLLVKDIFLIMEEISKKGTPILLVEENAIRALAIARYGYVLQNGRVAVSGETESLLKNDEVKKYYLGG